MNKIILSVICATLIFSCNSEKKDNTGGSGGNTAICLKDFNRKEMLTHWADDLIIPAIEGYNNSVNDLDTKVIQFSENTNEANLKILREALTNAYMNWESIAFYNIGPAVTDNLIFFTNTFPTNVDKIKENIQKGGNYDLNLSSQATQQGLPALDYLINGIATGDNNIVAAYTGTEGEKRLKYLLAVSERLKTLTNKILNTWKGSYKNVFIKNDGSSVSASVDRLANAYLLYYEKYMRNGKIRFPAGITQGTNNTYSEKVESVYNPQLSLPLLVKSLESMQNFFNGRLNDSSPEGLGLKQYLDKYNEVKKGQDIAAKINKKFDESIKIAKELETKGTLYNLIKTDTKQVLHLHDILQSNVINLKVDMLQALCIQASYVDGDGD